MRPVVAFLLFTLACCGDVPIFGPYIVDQKVTHDTCNYADTTGNMYSSVWIVAEAETGGFHKYYLFERDRMGFKMVSNNTKSWSASYDVDMDQNCSMTYTMGASTRFHEKENEQTMVGDYFQTSGLTGDGCGFYTWLFGWKSCVFKTTLDGSRELNR